MSVATTILEQIRATDPMALPAWGARDFVNMGDGVKFKTSGMTPWKGWVYVKYNAGRDLYEIQFFRVRRADVKMDKIVEDVYCDELVGAIDRMVG